MGNSAIVKTQLGAYVAIENIDMRFYTLKNVRDPEDAQDVATKQYVDKVGEVDAAIVKTQYGTYGSKGDIDM